MISYKNNKELSFWVLLIMTFNSHILIIDDVADNIQVAMNILKEDSYDFSFASNGEEALALIESEAKHFDLILLDIMMPKLDGYEVCRRLKSNPATQDIPVIFLTAKVDIDSIKKGFDVGAVDYLTKPFHSEELISRVKNHLDLYKAKRLLQHNNLSLETKINFSTKRLMTELESSQREMIYLLTELMESTSDETGKHIRRMAEICALIARYHPSLTNDDEEVLLNAAPLHDIGKMTVPPEILNKPGKLTEDEFVIMKNHTTNAYDLLKNSERRLFKAGAIIAQQHHEKWDGTGYPNQLKGSDIHIYGRIVALADVFDALTHERCYKEAWSADKALEYIEFQKGKQFDPDLVDIFSNHFSEFKAIAHEHK